MKQFEGIAENIETPILGLVTRNPLSLSRGNSVLVTEETSLLSRGFVGLITKDCGKKRSLLPQAKVSGEVLDKLEEGDCVLIGKDGIITVDFGCFLLITPRMSKKSSFSRVGSPPVRQIV